MDSYGNVTHNGDMTADDNVIKQVDKEYDCVLCGKTIINASARVVLSFIVTLFLLVGSFIYMFTRGSVNIFVPILAGIVGFWLPSPLQSNMSRKDALSQTRLMQSNMQMSRVLSTNPYLNIAPPSPSSHSNENDQNVNLNQNEEQNQQIGSLMHIV
jgi:hypothetical protein